MSARYAQKVESVLGSKRVVPRITMMISVFAIIVFNYSKGGFVFINERIRPAEKKEGQIYGIFNRCKTKRNDGDQ